MNASTLTHHLVCRENTGLARALLAYTGSTFTIWKKDGGEQFQILRDPSHNSAQFLCVWSACEMGSSLSLLFHACHVPLINIFWCLDRFSCLKIQFGFSGCAPSRAGHFTSAAGGGGLQTVSGLWGYACFCPCGWLTADRWSHEVPLDSSCCVERMWDHMSVRKRENHGQGIELCGVT